MPNFFAFCFTNFPEYAKMKLPGCKWSNGKKQTNNGVITTYILNGSQIIAEQRPSEMLVYVYDASIGGDFHITETKTETIGSKFRTLMKVFKGWLGID